MKRLWTGLLMLLLALALLTGALAETEDAEVAETVIETVVSAPGGAGDGDALLEGYFNREFRAGIRSAWLQGASIRRERAMARVGYEVLERDESNAGTARLYDALVPLIKAVAAGSRVSTVFEFPAADLGIDETRYSAAELGLDSLEATNQEQSTALLDALLAKADIHSGALMDALLSDYPYDLYWFDKTVGYSIGCSRYTSTRNGEAVTWIADLTVSMSVSRAYAAAGASFQTCGLLDKVSAAARNAAAIVNNNSGLGDYDRLQAYANKICELVGYDDAAAADDSTPYGDPWQLIYVFDEDPDTTGTSVVCEGYSKAFKYLCDETYNSDSPAVKCILVTGVMAGGTGSGPHMWNVVSMPDGRYYLVDVTNIDTGHSLFMKGCGGSGSYHTCAGLGYTYDEETLSTYGGLQSPWLAVSAHDYGCDYAVTVAQAEHGTASSVETADAGDVVTLTLTPESGYASAAPTISRGGDPVAAGDNAWSFTMPYGDVMVTPAFEMGQTGTIVASDSCGAQGDNLTWTLDENGLLIVSGTGDMADCTGDACPWSEYRLDIADVVLREGVSSIGDSAFRDCTSLWSVVLPSSLTGIGANAFRGCQWLQDAALPSGLKTIGMEAFMGCASLTAIDIPEGVTSIGTHAFMDCKGLLSATIPGSVATIGTSTFAACSALKNVTINEGVTAVGDMAFYQCAGLESVTLPAGVASIGGSAFFNCTSLESVSLPDSLTAIGTGAFRGCSALTGIELPGGLTGIGASAFYGSGLTAIALPKGVTAVADNTFTSCASLASVTLGPSVTTIGDMAFSGCGSLADIELPDGLTGIGASAFYNSGLRRIELPEGVTAVADSLFMNCASLASVTLGGNVTAIGDTAFSGCSSLTDIELPDGLTRIGMSAFGYCSRLERIVIPGGVTDISNFAFVSCGSLTDVTISQGVEVIGANAFRTCSSLEAVTLPDSLTAIGANAFESCIKLAGIAIPDGVTGIGASAFLSCIKLESVALPEGLTGIEAYTFNACVSLERLTIPGTVASIGANAIPTSTALYTPCAAQPTAFMRYAASNGISYALIHDWGEASYSWAEDHGSVTALRRCERQGCGAEETETVDATSTETRAATCLEEGETTYTSDAFENPAFTAQTETVANIAALGHDWGAASYTWKDDDSAVTAHRACLREGCGVEETDTAAVTYAVITEATCVSAGAGVYTPAAFENGAFETQAAKEVVIPVDPNNHDWGAASYTWADDDSAVTAHRACLREGCGVEETDTAAVTCAVITEATCVSAGAGVYTPAAFENGAFETQAAKRVVIPMDADNHDWGEVAYTWKDDDSAVTAHRACLREDCDVFEEETAVAALQSVQPPTQSEAGEAMYVSEDFSNAAFVAQRRAVEIPALGEMDVLWLPAGLTAIDGEAFAGLPCQAVIVPEGVTRIGERAFAGCENLIYVQLPAALTDIDGSAFEGCSRAILCRAGE